MGTPKRGKVPLSIITIVFCGLAIVALLYTERLSSVFRFKSCARRKAATKSFRAKKNHTGPLDYAADDRFVFDPEECTLNRGKWVFNTSVEPFYSDTSCPYLDRQVSCVKNGRSDLEYQHWYWQPDDCMLPRFDPKKALQTLEGKRIMFVGDSLQRGQWQSLVCLVESVIPQRKKSMKRGKMHSVFKAKEYNATIEFYWAPFLVESNSDLRIIPDPKKRILKVDSVAKHAKHWRGVDILVFNSYVWWMSGLKIKSLWGSFANGKEGYEELDAPVSYNLGLKTWANWVDSNINPNKTRVFFTTMSPTHQRFIRSRHANEPDGELFSWFELELTRWMVRARLDWWFCFKGYRKRLFEVSADWGNEKGIKCFNETKPVTRKWHWGTGSDIRIMRVVGRVLSKMKVPVRVLNITQLSEYRIDAHSSIYTETGGRLLTDEEKEDPLHHADCIHWCLPGVPDTWNRVLYAHLLYDHLNVRNTSEKMKLSPRNVTL